MWGRERVQETPAAVTDVLWEASAAAVSFQGLSQRLQALRRLV